MITTTTTATTAIITTIEMDIEIIQIKMKTPVGGGEMGVEMKRLMVTVTDTDQDLPDDIIENITNLHLEDMDL